jgi:hypothetical protein
MIKFPRWDFTSGVFIGWSWVHRDTTSNRVLSDVRGGVAYYKMILISLHHKNVRTTSDGKSSHCLWQGDLIIEWVTDCCLMPTQQFSSISWWEEVNFQWNDDEVCFVLDILLLWNWVAKWIETGWETSMAGLLWRLLIASWSIYKHGQIFKKSTNQKQELSVVVMFVNGSGQNE